MDAEVSIYRVIVPLEEINQTGSTKVNFEAAPSDLVRVGLDIASRLAEPKPSTMLETSAPMSKTILFATKICH